MGGKSMRKTNAAQWYDPNKGVEPENEKDVFKKEEPVNDRKK
jgi:hypothetical protein